MSQKLCLRSLGLAAIVAFSLTLAACGSKQSTTTGNGPAGGPTTIAQAERNALPMEKPAPVPRGLNCKGPIVWVNMNRKTYHESDDPYYGRTRHGEYMCQAAANAAGYHMAGSHRQHMQGGRTRYNDNATPTPNDNSQP